jgi:hypothetical protein
MSRHPLDFVIRIGGSASAAAASDPSDMASSFGFHLPTIASTVVGEVAPVSVVRDENSTVPGVEAISIGVPFAQRTGPSAAASNVSEIQWISSDSGVEIAG